MSIDLEQEKQPINPEEPKYERMLANLQGNILKSHGRNYAAHLFLRFTAAPQPVRSWIADFTNRFVTSAFRQLQETREYKINKISGRLFGGFYLSGDGYRKLECEIEKFQEDTNGNSAPVFFKQGMKAASETLSDPLPKTWDKGFRQEIHALILLADEDPRRLKDVRQRVEKSLKGIAKVVAVEEGFGLRDIENDPLEHFGYRDGISQPLYFQADVDDELQDTGGNIQWNPGAPLDLILVDDPLTDEKDTFGSYFVFRKLEQNVKGFKQAEENLATALKLKGKDAREIAGALVIGRFENGVPVTLSKTDQVKDLEDYNNFHYQNDLAGNKCPYHAHIRKTNPRGDTGFSNGTPDASELRHRITRRGITYGARELDPQTNLPTMKDRPEKNVGLLFMCFQSSIPLQFGFMQAAWSNNPNFSFTAPPNLQPVGLDPVTGQPPIENKAKFPPQWDNDSRVEFDFKGFVTLKGGEFFFAPSIPFLLGLDDLPEELLFVGVDQAEFQVDKKQ